MAFEAFHERDYRLFWTTQFISNIGSWMQGIAQGWLVYHLTDSPFLLGFVGFANSIPQFFLMLPGGVLPTDSIGAAWSAHRSGSRLRRPFGWQSPSTRTKSR